MSANSKQKQINQIKVCHLTSAHPENDIRIFHKQCISLSRGGFEVFLVASNATEKEINGVNIKTIKREYRGRLNRFLKTTNNVYRKALEINADIYHLHDPELLRIALKLKRKGKIVIYDSHEDVPKQIMDKHWIPYLLRHFISFCYSRYESYVCKRINGVISVTEKICQRFKRINKNVELIANYPLLEEADIIDKSTYLKKENQACYIGGLFPTRGISEIVEAVKHTKVNLILAGNFSPVSYRSKLENNEGWENVKYLGLVSRVKIMEILKTSSVGLVTLHPTKSYLDSLPIKMFEYMSAGLPVVASDFPEWKKIITETECGICVDPMNIDQISEAIQYVLQNKDKAKEMGINGKKAFRDKYNWKVEEKKLLKFYNTLIKLNWN